MRRTRCAVGLIMVLFAAGCGDDTPMRDRDITAASADLGSSIPGDSAVTPSTDSSASPGSDHGIVPPPKVDSAITPPPKVDSGVPPPPPGGAIIIDHTSIALFSSIPATYIDKARNTKLMIRHASIGDQIIQGLTALKSLDSKFDHSSWSFQNRGNPGYSQKIDDFTANTQSQLAQRDVFMFKHCFIDYGNPTCYGCSTPFNRLRDGYLLAQSYVNNTSKRIVWWTIPLTRSTGSATGQSINEQIRAHVKANKLILFDIADMEHYDRDTNQLCKDGSGLQVACQKYCAEQTPGGLSCHLSNKDPHNMVRDVAKAMWVLMARVAGWNPAP